MTKIGNRGQVRSVVDILGQRIAAGDYCEGETLPIEQELADSLGVGRNALREAVKVLSGKGLISTAPRSGTKIRSRNAWNMLDRDVLYWHSDPDIATPEFLLSLLEMRLIIEPRAAALAAKRATRDDIALILAAFDDMQAHKSDSEGRVRADIRLHTSVLAAAHNPFIGHFSHAVSAYLMAHSKIGGAADPKHMKADLELHHELAWHIARGKSDMARQCAEKMLSSGKARVANLLD